MESHGWNAAAEIPAMAELAMYVGDLVPATLTLVERRAIKDGKTSRFVVPVLDLAVSKRRLVEIVAAQTGASPAAIESAGAPGGALQLTSGERWQAAMVDLAFSAVCLAAHLSQFGYCVSLEIGGMISVVIRRKTACKISGPRCKKTIAGSSYTRRASARVYRCLYAAFFVGAPVVAVRVQHGAGVIGGIVS